MKRRLDFYGNIIRQDYPPKAVGTDLAYYKKRAKTKRALSDKKRGGIIRQGKSPYKATLPLI